MSDNPILASLTRLEAGQQALRVDMAELRDGQTALRADVTDLRADVTDLRADVTDLRADVTTLREGQTALRVDMMGRIERLENHITGIRDDIGVNMGRADRAHEAVVNARSDVLHLSQELSIMWRQIKRLESDIRDIKGEAA